MHGRGRLSGQHMVGCDALTFYVWLRAASHIATSMSTNTVASRPTTSLR
jgi:hypothetical protein